MVALRQAGGGREAGTSRHVKRAKSSGRERVAALGNRRGRRCRGPACRFARPRPRYVASGWAAGLVSQAGPSLLPSLRLCRACWFKLCKSLWEWGPFGSSRRSRSKRSSGSEKKKQQQHGPWVSLVLYAQSDWSGSSHTWWSRDPILQTRGESAGASHGCDMLILLLTHTQHPPPMPFSFISFPGARFSVTFYLFPSACLLH